MSDLQKRAEELFQDEESAQLVIQWLQGKSEATREFYIIYLYGRGGGQFFDHPICTKKPKCEECPLTNFCYWYKKQSQIYIPNPKRIFRMPVFRVMF